jgi:adenylate cyclase
VTDLPSTEEVRAELERVLSSSVFGRARRAPAFLRYIAEETLAGRASGISGYTIAVAVFGKAVDFDSASDPLVRVEAGRLRSRVIEYYATMGAADPVRIELQRGSYVPSFSYATPSRSQVVRPLRRSSWLVFGAPALLLIALASALLGRLYLGTSSVVGGADRATGPDHATASAPSVAKNRSGPRIFVQPFRNAGDQHSLSMAFGMTEEVMTRLARYPDLLVFVGSSGYFDGRAPSIEPVDGSKVDYLLTGSLRSTEQTIHVEPRLVDTRTGQQIWAASYEEPFDIANVWSILEDLAGTVATTVGEPYGPLFGAEVAHVEGAAMQNADGYHCMLRFLFAVQTMSESAHARATACFEQVVAMEPTSSMGWARLAALYRMEYLHDFNARHDDAPALDRALEAVRKALDVDHDNVFAYEELGFISLLRDDSAGAEEALARALALNPSADVRAAIGINFVKMGDTERGFALIERGMAESPRAPPFFFLGYVVNSLRVGDDDAAFNWAERMATPEWPLGQAILAAIAARTRRDDVAQQAAERLLALRPDFAANGRELVRRGRLGPQVESEVLDGLARAGVHLR